MALRPGFAAGLPLSGAVENLSEWIMPISKGEIAVGNAGKRARMPPAFRMLCPEHSVWGRHIPTSGTFHPDIQHLREETCSSSFDGICTAGRGQEKPNSTGACGNLLPSPLKGEGPGVRVLLAVAARLITGGAVGVGIVVRIRAVDRQQPGRINIHAVTRLSLSRAAWQGL